MKRYISIKGIGSYLPKRKVDSFEIDRMLHVPEGWTLKSWSKNTILC